MIWERYSRLYSEVEREIAYTLTESFEIERFDGVSAEDYKGTTWL